MLITDEILTRAKQYPDRLAIVTPRIKIKYGELEPAHLLDLPDERVRYLLRTGGTINRKKFFHTDSQVRELVVRFSFAKGEHFPTTQTIYCPEQYGEPGYAIHARFYMLLGGKTLFSRELSTPIEEALFMCEEHKVEGAMLSPKMVGFGQYLDYSRSFRFKHLFIGGAPLLPEKMHQLKVGLGGTLYFNYGNSEAGTIAGGDYEEVSHTNGCVGRVYSDRILDFSTGEIRIKGGPLVSGDGWYYPGDKGYMKEGQLVLTGRTTILPKLPFIETCAIVSNTGEILEIIRAKQTDLPRPGTWVVPVPPELVGKMQVGSHKWNGKEFVGPWEV